MKKLLLIVAIATTIVSCSYEAFDRLYYTDFTRYENSGILVSSITDYTGVPYVALGDIAVQSFDSGGFEAKTIDPQQALDKVVDVAKQKGANGVIGYSAHYTHSGNGRGYWYATGVAVRFENMPFPSTKTLHNEPQTQQKSTVELHKGEYDSLKQEQKIELARRTVDYLIANKMPFESWNLTGDTYFDIAQKRYIPQEEFQDKYGEDVRRAIELMYKDARKVKRKEVKHK